MYQLSNVLILLLGLNICVGTVIGNHWDDRSSGRIEARSKGMLDRREGCNGPGWSIWPSPNRVGDIIRDIEKVSEGDIDPAGDAARLMIGRTEGVMLDEIIRIHTQTKGKLGLCELDDPNTPIVMSVKYFISTEESTTKSFPVSRSDLANERPANGEDVKVMPGLETPLWPRLLAHAMRQFTVKDADLFYPALPPLKAPDGDFPCKPEVSNTRLCDIVPTITRFTGRRMVARQLSNPMDAKQVEDVEKILVNAEKSPVFLWSDAGNFTVPAIPHVVLSSKSVHDVQTAKFPGYKIPEQNFEASFKTGIDLTEFMGEGDRVAAEYNKKTTTYLVYLE